MYCWAFSDALRLQYCRLFLAIYGHMPYTSWPQSTSIARYSAWPSGRCHGVVLAAPISVPPLMNLPAPEAPLAFLPFLNEAPAISQAAPLALLQPAFRDQAILPWHDQQWGPLANSLHQQQQSSFVWPAPQPSIPASFPSSGCYCSQCSLPSQAVAMPACPIAPGLALPPVSTAMLGLMHETSRGQALQASMVHLPMPVSLGKQPPLLMKRGVNLIPALVPYCFWEVSQSA